MWFDLENKGIEPEEEYSLKNLTLDTPHALSNEKNNVKRYSDI